MGLQITLKQKATLIMISSHYKDKLKANIIRRQIMRQIMQPNSIDKILVHMKL